jgi:hypothetical protein
LGEHLVNGDRLMAYKLRDTWKQGKSIVNPKQLAQDKAFINASRQYLTVNTPLKDLMFRHTRDTLRQYYQLSILDTPPLRLGLEEIVVHGCPSQLASCVSLNH